jgi:two-component system, sensor histidine kinase
MLKTKDHLEIINLLNRFTSDYTRINNLHELAISVESILENIMEIEFSGLYLYDFQEKRLKLLAAKGFNEAELAEAESTAWERHPGYVFRKKEILNIPDTENDPENRSISSSRSFVVRSRLYIPVMNGDQAVGAFGIVSSKKDQFDSETVTILSLICNIAGGIYGNIIAKAEPTNFISIQRDITEQKTSRNEIELITLRLATLMKNLHSGILVEDENRYIVLINKTFCDLFSIPVEPEILMGTDCSDSANQSKHLFHDPVFFINHINQILEQKKPVIGEELELADGRVFERDYIPVFQGEKFLGNLWQYRDISDRKNQEQTVKQQEEKYRNIFANMKMGLLETDNDDIVQDVNHQFCEMSGYSREEIIGKKSVDLLVREEFKQLVNEKSLLRIEGVSDIYQVQVMVKNGDLRWWLTSGGPNFNDKGKLIGTVGISVDITQQKILEHELEIARIKAEESSVAKETFLANMSHEIRTPLNAIIGIIREFSRESLSPKQSLYIKNAALASQHLLSTLNDILDISKIESGQMALVNRPFDLNEVINDAISILTSSAQEKMLKITSGISQMLAPAYMGDSIRIRQVLLNIINNAIKFTEKGLVSVDCIVEGVKDNLHQIQIKVTDTGIGMDEGFVKNIFDKFSQVDFSNVRKYGGTGLGMTIVNELIHLMNGTINISSSIGSGTTVEISFDLERANENELPAITTEEGFNSLKNKKILLVEDNDLNRMVAENLLSYYGILVSEAINGVEAIEKLKTSEYDLILMDLQMPEMGGIEAASIIRQEMKLNIPIIALTANAFKAELDRCMSAGMNDYITKPYEENVLLEAILHCLPPDNNTPLANDDQPGDKKKQLYNFEYLFQFSRGRMDLIKKMTGVFIEQTPVAVEKLRKDFASGDFESIYKTAHYMKSNIDMFGIDDLKQDIRKVESIAKKGLITPELEALIQRIDEVINRVVEELRQEKL